jgi:hypothetical protein
MKDLQDDRLVDLARIVGAALARLWRAKIIENSSTQQNLGKGQQSSSEIDSAQNLGKS